MNKVLTVLFAALISTVSVQAAFLDNVAVKLRVAYLEPTDESNAFSALGIDFPADAISVEDKWIPEFDITYSFTENLVAEVVLTIPQDHTVTLAGVGDLGELTHLPPTFSLVYEFNNDSNLTPYVSAGLNITWIMDADLEVAGVTLDLDDFSFGAAVGAGVKYELDETWDIDVSIKWIQLDSDVTAGGTTLTTATLDPLLFSIGAVYNF